jgi:hypothetical protein
MLMANCFAIYNGNMVEGSAHALLPGNWDSYRQWEKFIMPDGAAAVLQTAADPPGHYLTGVYSPPIIVGEMSMRTDGAGDLTGDLYPSRNMSIDLTGAGTLSADAALAIAMLCAMTGSGDLAAAIEGRLNMSIDMEGAGDLAADLSGLGNMAIALSGSGDLEATIAAYGNMAIDIVVTGTGLTTANVGEAVWTYLIEAGFSAEQIMRMRAAVDLGNATGLESGNPSFTGLDGTTERVAGTYSGGTRTITTRNGD